MIHKVIWLVFYTLAIAMLAAILYNVLFVYDYDRVNTEAPGDANVDGVSGIGTIAGGKNAGVLDGKGALWVAADTIQNGCSYFFYQYAYLPMIHQNDEIDQQLGVQSDYFMMDETGAIIEDSASTVAGYKNTPTDLSGARIYTVDDISGDWYSEKNY